jgi:Na+-transporting NADH:ubiquinone oxidoreductase subunit NqrB
LLVIKFSGIPAHSIKSAIITSLGLSLLLKTNSPILFFLAGSLAIGQKFAFKVNGKHLWNPANFSIIILVLLSENAWVSPGQWGSSAILVLLIAVAGLNVISRVNRIETGLAFILTLAILEYGRTILYLGWGHEVWLHKLSSGTLWLFAFFMITDPMTSPNNKKARMIWAICIAIFSFVLTNFYFINAAPQWVLFALTPFTVIIDKLVRGESFNWLKKTEIDQPINTQVQ